MLSWRMRTNNGGDGAESVSIPEMFGGDGVF